MASFRSFLARERLVPVEQLDRALQRQILYGEDLCVNLLEVGAVGEDELAQFLGMFHRMPIVTRSDLDGADPSVAALVPAPVALRHRVCPVAVADNTMVVACLRPPDRAVADELARLTGYSVTAAIATPIALAWGLFRHYGEQFPDRYRRLDAATRRQEGKAEAPAAGDAATAAAESEETPERSRRVSGIIVLPGDLPESEERSSDAADAVPATASATVVPPSTPALEVSGDRAEAPPPVTEEEAAAEELLRGVTFADRTAQDRLFEAVIGPPSADEGGEPAGGEPAGEGEAARGAERPPGMADAAPGAPDAVVAIRGVLVQAPGDHSPSFVPSAVRSLMGAPSMPPRTPDLLDRVAHIDRIDRPYEVLRYAFYLFSSAFRCGLLIDAMHDLRIREAFGAVDAAALRGRVIAPGVLPRVVLGAAQPLLVPIDPADDVAGLLMDAFGSPPHNALFLPVVVGRRVVAVLYGDNRDAPTSFEQVRDLFHVAWVAGERLARLARERRGRAG